MDFFSLLSFTIILFTPQITATNSIIPLLLTIKASLDPKGLILTSWSPNATDPCNGSFEGIACNEVAQVVNISLQGKGLDGQIPPEIGQLKSLSGLYLHFNQLHGVVPMEITYLIQLSDLYLNVNNLSGQIPPQLGNMANLQVLQLCYNKFNGSIPTQLGSLKNVNVLALQYNELTGAIPASLGNLETLTRLDLSYNHLFGSIPAKLADSQTLQVLDIRNNTLSGNVPIALKKLNEGFQYTGNPGLCGIGFSSLNVCDISGLNPTKPEPSEPSSNRLPSKTIPESANVQSNSFHKSRQPQTTAILGVIALFVIVIFISIFSFTWYRRRKQKIGSTHQTSDTRLSTDRVKEVSRRSASPLINLEYSHSWDPLGNGLSQEVFESFMFNLEEMESATKYFSDKNLLGKGNFSAIYEGSLRDGSTVAIKCISKTSCKSDESEFLEGLKLLTSLKHENVLRLRGFCCSKGRGECFLVYDFVPNGNLLKYLDSRNDTGLVLEWSVRVMIIKGIAKGIEYLHGNKDNKPALVHRNISAEKVLLGQNYNPMLSDCGVHKLLADDIVFSTLKGSAAMGYLAPEYTTTGRFNEKSDMYAFGMIILQILSGKSKISLCELGMHGNFIDANLEGIFGESDAVDKLIKIALLCTHENPNHRPAISVVMQDLDDIQ